MPTYKVTDPQSGRVLSLTGDSPPTEQELNDIFSKVDTPNSVQDTATPPQESILQLLGRNLSNAANKTYTEGVAPVLKGMNTALFGIPREIVKAGGATPILTALNPNASKVIGGEMDKTLFPEQSTLGGKALDLTAQTAGMMLGGPGKLALKIAPRLAKGATLLPRAAQAAKEGAVLVGSQAPDTNQSVGNMAGQVSRNIVAGGALGGALPIAGAGLNKLGGVITNTGRWVAKNVGGVTDATVAAIKRLGADRVFTPEKAQAGYIANDLAPKVYDEFSKSVSDFTAPIQKYAKDVLKIPETAINTIKDKGVAYVQKVRDLLGDSTDTIKQKIDFKLNGMFDEAGQAFTDAMSKVDDKTPVSMNKTFSSLKGILKRYGYVDEGGAITDRAKKANENLVLKRLSNLYDDIRNSRIYGDNEVALNSLRKPDIELAKMQLSELFKDKSTDPLVGKVWNSFYDDLSKGGFSGIDKARALYRNVNEASDIAKVVNKESLLDRFHNITGDQSRTLSKLESKVGFKFVDDLNSLTSARELDKIAKGMSMENIIKDFIRAKNPEYTKMIEGKYKNLLGDNFKNVWDDLNAHFANIDFNLVSETPGAGGGMYPSRSGAIRAALTSMTKKYYKDIAPKIISNKPGLKSATDIVNRLILSKGRMGLSKKNEYAQ